MEAFLAEHNNVTIDDVLYNWPSTKFQAMYTAYAKRKIADQLDKKRSLELAALWGNTNMDMKENREARHQLINDIDQQYSRAIAMLYDEVDVDDADVDTDDPFFAAMERGIEKSKLPEPKVSDIDG